MRLRLRPFEGRQRKQERLTTRSSAARIISDSEKFTCTGTWLATLGRRLAVPQPIELRPASTMVHGNLRESTCGTSPEGPPAIGSTRAFSSWDHSHNSCRLTRRIRPILRSSWRLLRRACPFPRCLWGLQSLQPFHCLCGDIFAMCKPAFRPDHLGYLQGCAAHVLIVPLGPFKKKGDQPSSVNSPPEHRAADNVVAFEDLSLRPRSLTRSRA